MSYPIHNIESITVDIVLATFNGEKYLEQQLNSLIMQTHQNWKLLISDDGSSDLTLTILHYFSSLDSRIAIVNTIRQGGVVANFTKALSFVTSDYVLFCDQDDVWSDNKINLMLKNIFEEESKLGKLTPILGFSDATLVNHDLSIICPSFYGAHNLNPLNNLDGRFLIWRSSVYGCTVIFNKALYEMAMPMPYSVPMHDQWFALVASFTGRVFYMPIQLTLYRQHVSNVIGARPKGAFKWLLAIFENFRNIKKDISFSIKQIRSLNSIRFREDNTLKNVLYFSRGLSSDSRMVMKLRFVLGCVMPFWREKKIYTTLFSVLFILKRVDEE